MNILKVLIGVLLCINLIGCSSEAEKGNQQTALMKAIQEEDVNSIKKLIDKESNINAKDNQGKTALMHYIMRTNKYVSNNRYVANVNPQFINIEILRSLFSKDADPNIKDNDGKTVLWYSLDNPFFEEILNKSDPNIIDNIGKTVLFKEVEKAGSEKVISLLLAKGLDVNIQDNQGKTALMYAILSLEERKKKSIEDGEKNNGMLMYPTMSESAVAGEIERTVNLLLKNHANPNLQDKDGKTALMYVSNYPSESSIATVSKVLLRYGANPNIKDKDGHTANYYYEEGKKIRIEIAQTEAQQEQQIFRDNADKHNNTSYSSPKIGMTMQEVLDSTWGKPKKINKTTTANGTSEQWVYPSLGYVYFDNGYVTAIQEEK